MKVVVCIKQTPSTTAVFSVDNGQVTWDDPGGKPLVLNPWDEYAVEEALRLQDENGGDTVALTVGPESSHDALKTCLAMGCGEAVQVWDSAFEGSDTLGTARILAASINKVSDVDLAIFGCRNHGSGHGYVVFRGVKSINRHTIGNGVKRKFSEWQIFNILVFLGDVGQVG